jgi:hypothetical protein
VLRVLPEDIKVSFDVVSLFTKVPVTDTLQLLGQHFEEDLLALFRHVLTSTYFCFEGQFYKQTDGVAMGSPLSPVVASFFMEDFEKRAIEQATHKPTCWFRYVDDTFVIWKHGQEKLTEFLNQLNGLHNNIQFMVEKEEDGHLPVLDIDIYRKLNGFLGHRVYRKPTDTNLYLHHNSHHHPSHKQSVLTSLIHRATAISDQDFINQELEFLTTVFGNNGYSIQQIRRAMKLPTKTPRQRTNRTQRHTCKQPTEDSAQCWSNTILKVSHSRRRKYLTTSHLSRMLWD